MLVSFLVNTIPLSEKCASHHGPLLWSPLPECIFPTPDLLQDLESVCRALRMLPHPLALLKKTFELNEVQTALRDLVLTWVDSNIPHSGCERDPGDLLGPRFGFSLQETSALTVAQQLRDGLFAIIETNMVILRVMLRKVPLTVS